MLLLLGAPLLLLLLLLLLRVSPRLLLPIAAVAPAARVTLGTKVALNRKSPQGKL